MAAESGRRRTGPLGRFAVAVLSLLLGVIASAAHPAAAHASMTTAGAATFTYDFSAVARVYAHEFVSADASPTQLSDVREHPASPRDGARGTFTTPGSRSVATEGGSTLFRGTTEGYPGSPGRQLSGVTPTSTDPAVATAFGVRGNEFGSGVVHIASPGDIAGAKLYGPSLGGLEAEVGVGMLPAEFASRAGATIPAQQAQAILEQMGVSVPGRIPTTASLNSWLGTRTPMTPEQIAEFVRRATGG